MSTPHVRTSQVAKSVPFDNATNGFNSTNVQDAIEESVNFSYSLEATATASVTAGTGADALLTGMTLTPPAGDYLVWFSCDLNSSTVGAATSFSLYVGGTQKADSLRKVQPFDGGTLSAGAARCGVAINGKVTVNGSQAIEVRWSASGGTNAAASRTMNILRIR